MNNLPRDPFMLFSYSDMKLRDEYSSLDALCEDLDVNREVLETTLGSLGYKYSPEHNKFW